MESANEHRPTDDRHCRQSNSATKLIDGQKKSGRVANIVRSTTCCILDQFKRQVPDADQQKQQVTNTQEQRYVGANLTRLLSQINQPITVYDHNASKSTTNKCCWSNQSSRSISRTNSSNGRTFSTRNKKSPLTHSLSTPSSHLMHHNGCVNIRINYNQREFSGSATPATTTADTSCPSGGRLSRRLGRLVQAGAAPPIVDDTTTRATAAMTNNGGHRVRVLKFNQREDLLSGRDVKGVVVQSSSVDTVSNQGDHRTRLMVDLSLVNKLTQTRQDKDYKLNEEPVAFGPAETDENEDIDGGYAWIVLIVIFVINASTFGTARAYGLIFDKLAREDDKGRTEAAMPFTIMGAVENMAGPLSGYLLAKTNNSWRATVFSGSCLITLAHLLAALLADSQLGQLLSMGLMCGLGLSLVSISFFQLNNAYFVRYRSTAFGLGMTGAAFGTLYISPLCQYFLDNYGTSMCYLMLSLILLPNVPLSLLLKPKNEPTVVVDGQVLGGDSRGSISIRKESVEDILLNANHANKTISAKVEAERKRSQSGQMNIWHSVRRVVCNPMFHLIWPTQLLFCWLNFVFGMIIVDFGRDRGLNTQDVSYLVPCWAFGQLVGRLFLSSLIDLKFLTYKSFTVICFFSISATTLSLNHIRLPTNIDDYQQYKQGQQETTFQTSQYSLMSPTHHMHAIFLVLVFILSIFIALLFILFNGLIVNYVDTELHPLSIGISSFTGSFFLLPRANIIGYYRDTTGNYDTMFTMFTYISLCAALAWLILPEICSHLKRLYSDKPNKLQVSHSKTMDKMRVYSEWKFTSSIQTKENQFKTKH